MSAHLIVKLVKLPYIPWEQLAAGPDWSPVGSEEFSGAANDAIKDVQGFQLLSPVPACHTLCQDQLFSSCVCLGGS